MAKSDIKWFEATFEVDGKSVRVQYLSDRELNNNQIADLVARGQDYGRAWIGDRAQGSAARIEKAAEMVREAGAPTETGVARRATQAEIDRFSSTRTAEYVGSAAREIAEAIVETGERVASAVGLRPVSTGQIEREREEIQEAGIVRGGRSRPATLVAETAAGERLETGTAAGRVEIPPAEAPKAETATREARVEVRATGMFRERAVHYVFEVDYNGSKVTGDFNDSLSFFYNPENRDSVIRFRYRTENGEWSNWFAGQAFADKFVTLFSKPVGYEVRDSNGEIVERITLYIDRQKAGEERDLQKLIEMGAAVAFSTGPAGNLTRWRNQTIDEHLAFLRGKYGEGLSITLT